MTKLLQLMQSYSAAGWKFAVKDNLFYFYSPNGKFLRILNAQGEVKAVGPRKDLDFQKTLKENINPEFIDLKDDQNDSQNDNQDE